MTWEPLPTSPYSPKNSPIRSGGDSRTISTRSATVTPPRPEPRIAPATRNGAQPGRAEAERDPADDEPDRPRGEDDRAASASGPSRSAEPAPHEAHRDGDHGQPEQDDVGRRVGHAERLGRDDAHHDDDRVDRVAVEEPAEEEAPETGHRPSMLDRRSSWPNDATTSATLRAGSSGSSARGRRGRSGWRTRGRARPSAGTASSTGMSSRKISSPTKTVPQ